jgi:hypothetical protein
VCEGFFHDSLKILRGDGMKKSIVEERMAKVLASRVGLRKSSQTILSPKRGSRLMRCGLSAARASARRVGVTGIGKKKEKGSALSPLFWGVNIFGWA